MTPTDYARMADQCAKAAEDMQPGPERDDMLKKAKLFSSYANMDKWITSSERQPPE